MSKERRPQLDYLHFAVRSSLLDILRFIARASSISRERLPAAGPPVRVGPPLRVMPFLARYSTSAHQLPIIN